MSDSHESHVIGGHKAAISNPNVSVEAKLHSKEVLEKEFEGGHIAKDEHEKDPKHVEAGLKGTLKNPNVSFEAKKEAEARLEEEFKQ
ncbi:hypothetical protein ANO11243_088600 [Dothideomycetidae sp. 11243]|nr:hypothetical protein ANO11243_088600 [fungal sp. No.11243]